MKRSGGWRPAVLGVASAIVLASAIPLLGSEYISYAEQEPAAPPAALDEPAPPPADAPPLPFHSIEGYGGGAITPMAYLVNPGPEGCGWGKPAVALTYVGLGHKNLSVISVTETLWGRVEFGYAGDRLGLGTLPGDIRDATTVDIEHSDLWLHNFNIRTLLIKENTCFGGLAMPAMTAGIHFKYNDSTSDINRRLGGVLHNNLGYERSNGTEFTLTFSRTIPPEVLGRPLILSAGLRESQAANLGFLGFTDKYRASFECNAAYLLRDNVLVAYEFRQKSSPFSGEIAGLVEGEDNWHAFDVSYIMKQATLVGGYGIFGNLANAEANSAWWLQLKYEF